ncbi:DUF3095 family protein [Sulfitobacter sediminilitoris]|uniref:DUF3095 family protein n=1 Tax=Sulfitobacter sediminilitoris TaxID=2698830 RepID=UPI003609348C
MSEQDPFYDRLPRVDSFAALTESAMFRPLPEDWWIGVADIMDSTGLIEAGQYKTVNMVGAAVISAMINALEGLAFPFVFGGDGAGFAVPPQQETTTRDTLPKVARWAQTEFGITLRSALFRVSDIRAAGLDVRVARYRVSEGVDYAMFEGGGLNWAEAQMKAGAGTLALAPQGSLPDLTGLSCRWSHMPARNGTILTLLAAPCRVRHRKRSRRYMIASSLGHSSLSAQAILHRRRVRARAGHRRVPRLRPMQRMDRAL